MDGDKEVCKTPVSSEAPTHIEESENNCNKIHSKSPTVKLPQYRYSRDQLLSWRDVRCSRLKPTNMSKEYESSEGVWDPEKWFNSTVADGANSSTTSTSNNYHQYFNLGEKMYSRGRKTEWEMDEGGRRGPPDRGPSLRQNMGDSEVVLMPQRSFNSGCYVNNNLEERTSTRRDGREQKFGQRVVGSGRIPVVDRLKGRTEENENWNDRSYGANRSRGKVIERRPECNESGRLDYKSSNREMRRSQYSEPSWFRDGPSSQSDTIELHGFNGPEPPNKVVDKGKKNSAVIDRLFGAKMKSKEGDGKEHKESGDEFAVKDEKKENRSSLAGRESAQESSNVAEVKDEKEEEQDRNSSVQSNKQTQQPAGDFDFDTFFKAVNIPEFPTSELDSTASRFQAFFSNQANQETFANGLVATDKRGSGLKLLPPPPPIYGHNIERTIDPDEEKKNFMNILQKAQLVPGTSIQPNHHNNQLHQVDATNEAPSMPSAQASLKDYESDIKALLNVNPSGPPSDARSNNGELAVVYGPILNGGNADRSTNSTSGNALAITRKPLPVGSKVTRVTDLEGDSLKAERSSAINMVGLAGPSAKPEEDMTAFNKLLGLIQLNPAVPGQQKPQTEAQSTIFNKSSANSSTHSFLPSVNQQTNQHQACTSATSYLQSVNNDRKQNAASPTARPSPIAFGTCPPTNLATPMPIHASQMINQFVTNQHGSNVHYNSFDPMMKFNNQNSIEQISKESLLSTSQASEKLHPAFLPTAVIRQMVHDKEKKRGLKIDADVFFNSQSEIQNNNQDGFPPASGSKFSQDTLWTFLRSNQGGETGGGAGSIFQPRPYNFQPPHHSFHPHPHFQQQAHQGMPYISRPQQPMINNVSTFLQCLQQGRVVPHQQQQPQQQPPIFHSLIQQQIQQHSVAPMKRAIVKGANHPSLSINTEQNLSLGNQASMHGNQVDPSAQAAVLAAIRQALSANQKHHQQNAVVDNHIGLDGWLGGGAPIANKSTGSRLPNQVKLQ